MEKNAKGKTKSESNFDGISEAFNEQKKQMKLVEDEHEKKVEALKAEETRRQVNLDQITANIEKEAAEYERIKADKEKAAAAEMSQIKEEIARLQTVRERINLKMKGLEDKEAELLKLIKQHARAEAEAGVKIELLEKKEAEVDKKIEEQREMSVKIEAFEKEDKMLDAKIEKNEALLKALDEKLNSK